MSATYICGRLGCATLMTGIYCTPHRDSAAEALRAARAAQAAERSARLKALWETRGAEMKAAIAAGKAPAKEGK